MIDNSHRNEQGIDEMIDNSHWFRFNSWFRLRDLKGKQILKTASNRSTYYHRLALANAYKDLFRSL